MEPGSHDETYLEFVCEIMISFDSLGVGSFIEGEELLAIKYIFSKGALGLRGNYSS
jgi:hypothetical protein